MYSVWLWHIESASSRTTFKSILSWFCLIIFIQHAFFPSSSNFLYAFKSVFMFLAIFMTRSLYLICDMLRYSYPRLWKRDMDCRWWRQWRRGHRYSQGLWASFRSLSVLKCIIGIRGIFLLCAKLLFMFCATPKVRSEEHTSEL